MATISSVTVVSPRKLTIEFSEIMSIEELGVASWSFAGTGTPPFATPTMSYIEGVDDILSPQIVDVFLSFDLSPGKPYTVTITDVASAAFSVPALPVVSGRKFTLLSWIPPDDLRKDDTMDLRYFIAVLDDMLALIVNDVDAWPDIQDPDKAPEPFVDQMLSDLGNPIEDAAMTLMKKRLLVKSLVALYKMRGTGPGIIHTIYFFLGLEATLVPFNRQGMRLGVSLLGLDWVLGCGPNRGQLLLRIGTPEGRALTNYEQRVLKQILKLHQNAFETIQTQAVLAAPTGVSAEATGTPDGITVSWSAVEGATSYVVCERSVTGVNIFNGKNHAVASGLSLEIPMTAGQHRYFVVAAVNVQGVGLESTEVDAVAG